MPYHHLAIQISDIGLGGGRHQPDHEREEGRVGREAQLERDVLVLDLPIAPENRVVALEELEKSN